MADYAKYTRGDMVYYIATNSVSSLPTSPDGDFENVSDLPLHLHADFVVDTHTNTLVKCRSAIATLIDLAHTVRPIKSHPVKIARSVETLRDELVARLSSGHMTVEGQEILMKINSCLYKEYPYMGHE